MTDWPNNVPQYVTSLPASPWDGQEIFYAADATNGVHWHLRYRAGSGSAYKWEFLGGAPMTVEILTSETTTSTTYADLTTAGPSITLPLAGDYDLQYAATVSNNTATATSFMSPKLGTAATSDNDSIQSVAPAINAGITVSKRVRRTAFTASAVVKMQYRVGSNTGEFFRRELHVIPVRVG